MKTLAESSQLRRILLGLATILLVLVSSAQDPAVPARTLPAFDAPPLMNRFVLIFTQAPREFSEADLRSRAERVQGWAERQAREGRRIDPRILGLEGRRISADRHESEATTPDRERLGSLVFIEARDLADAVEVARDHPGLDFGAGVEIRPWAPPLPPKR